MENIIGKKIVLQDGQEFWYSFDDCISQNVFKKDIVELWHGRTGTAKHVNKRIVHIWLDEIDVGNGLEKADWIYMTIDNFKNYFENEEEKEMGIKIKTEKTVDSSGVVGRKILDVQGLGRDELPELYLSNENAIVVNDFHGDIYFSQSLMSVLKKNHFYSEEHFQDALKKIALAGDILHDVNKELKKMKTMWNGEETFVI